MTRAVSAESASLLLVEDDEELAELIAEYLGARGYGVTVQSDGAKAVEQVCSGQFDMVVLDLMLPGMDGISVCREVRHRFSGPVLMLTASADVVDQVVGLEVGADDFVQKPVEPRVLLARIRALLRRATAAPVHRQPESELCFDELVINPSANQATLAGRVLTLSAAEFDVLYHLAQNAGRIVSRDEIFSEVRNIPYDGLSRFADIAVSQIRKQLGSAADRFVKTVRGRGYLFIVGG